MEKKFFKLLLEKISEGTASDKELLLYQKWYDQQLLEELDQEELTNAKAGVSKEIYRRLQSIFDDSESTKPSLSGNNLKTKALWKRWLVSAAAILLVIGLGLHYLNSQKPIQIIQKDYKQVNFDTTQGVVLKLSNGKKIDLTAISNDSVNQFTDNNAVKTTDKLQYDLPSSNEKSIAVEQQEVFHTLYTPAEKKFQIVLCDGTKVWLNSKSMLRFPVKFSGKQRRVQLIGEGYFEVVTNSAKPFIVESKGQELEVLGTKFNIDAYHDASVIKSTLFEGKVSVTNLRTNQKLILLPGDQAVLSPTIFEKNKVLLKNVLGWKNGYFVFHNEKIEDICNSLSRWYNVRFFTFKNPKVLNQVFCGTVPRFENIDDVLAVLAETGTIKFKREGRRIVIMN